VLARQGADSLTVRAAIESVAYHLPDKILGNAELAALSDDWTADKIADKTGVSERRIAASDDCASDLAAAAARKLFASGACRPEDVGFVLLCTQSPDYFLPTSACLIQERLGIPTTAGALDFNLGCSGYVYGLGLARGLIETGQACRVLLLTADTYSKFIEPRDLHVRTLFGDAGTATLLGAVESDSPKIGPFVYGTDGRGANNLIVRSGAARVGFAVAASQLEMNGPEIFTFTLSAVPQAMNQLLDLGRVDLSDIDLFIFHQANEFMLTHLRKKLKIPEDRFYVALKNFGNTVSSTIPIALSAAIDDGSLRRGMLIALVGFGVGYSWGATLVRW